MALRLDPLGKATLRLWDGPASALKASVLSSAAANLLVVSSLHDPKGPKYLSIGYFRVSILGSVIMRFWVDT